MSRFEIRARKGYWVSDKDARLIAEVIAELGPGATVDQFIQYAEPEQSKIHHLWDWDKEAAYERDKKVRARYLMRSYEHVEIEVTTSKELRQIPGTVSFNIHDVYETGAKGGEKTPEPELYYDSLDVLRDERLTSIHLRELRARFAAIRREYRAFENALKERSPGLQLVIEGIEQMEQEDEDEEGKEPT